MRNQIASIGINQSEETYLLAPKSLYKGEPLYTLEFPKARCLTAILLLSMSHPVVAIMWSLGEMELLTTSRKEVSFSSTSMGNWSRGMMD